MAGSTGPVMVRAGYVRDALFGLMPSWLLGLEPRPTLFRMVPLWLTPLTASVIERDFALLLVDVTALELFGPAVERALGHVPMLMLIIAAAWFAGMAQLYSGPSGTPMLGAEGIVSGVLGAALLSSRGTALKVSAMPFRARLSLPATSLLVLTFVSVWRLGSMAADQTLAATVTLQACLVSALCGAILASIRKIAEASRVSRGIQTAAEEGRLIALPCILVLYVSLLALRRLIHSP